MSDLISQYRQLHKDPKAFPGRATSKYHAWQIGRMIDRNDVHSLLDYGCGKGHQYSEDFVNAWWETMCGHPINIRLYDPAVDEFERKPDRVYDGVICVDVLEHLEEVDVEATLRELVRLADRMLFVTACDRPAKRLLPDGRNAHLIVKPMSWWRELLVDSVERYGTPYLDAKIEFTP